jgi:hypothetical protein
MNDRDPTLPLSIVPHQHSLLEDAGPIPSDPGLDAVRAHFHGKPNLEATFAAAIRQAIDEVLDGPRTGRFQFSELEKTEKTYVGTRIEIVVRSALGLEKRGRLDTLVAGQEMDIKWSASQNWMIPTEAIDELCLLVGTRKQGGHVFDIGLIRCTLDVLSSGSNKDKKRSLSSVGKQMINWLVREGQLAPNFLATLPADLAQRVFAEKSGQARLRRLFTGLPPGTPVPRIAAATLGQQDDPMRRLRSDKSDRLPGLKILSGRFEANRDAVSFLGYGVMPRDTFVAVPRNRLAGLPPQLKAALKLDI